LNFGLQGALKSAAKEEKHMSNKSKKIASVTRDQARKIFAKYGIGEFPKGHPIYSEPRSITFISRPPKPSELESEVK